MAEWEKIIPKVNESAEFLEIASVQVLMGISKNVILIATKLLLK